MRKTATLLFAACLLLASPVLSFAASGTEIGSSTITAQVPSTHALTVTAAEGVTVSYGDTSITGGTSGTEDSESSSGGTSGTEDSEGASGGTSGTEDSESSSGGTGGESTGSASLDVPRLEKFTLTITVESGYAISGIYLNGEDVTAQLVGDTLTLSGIHADARLVIETAEVSSDIRGVLYDLPEQDFPDSSLLYKVAVEVSGLTEVPEALQEIESLNTVEKISAVMKDILIGICSYPDANMVIYEVTLVVSDDNGQTWEAAEEEHFPENGLTVVLPYPEGTAKDTQDFAALHMFTSTAFGKKPGDTEAPAVTKTDDGLQVTLTGLSPVAIAWADIAPESTEDTEAAETEASEATEPGATEEAEATEGAETTEEAEATEEGEATEEVEVTEATEELETETAETGITETESTEATGTAGTFGESGDGTSSSGISGVIAAVAGAVTGDAGMFPWLLMLIAACGILLAVARCRKKQSA